MIETNLSRNWNRVHSDVEPTYQDILPNILLEYMFFQNAVKHYTPDFTQSQLYKTVGKIPTVEKYITEF